MFTRTRADDGRVAFVGSKVYASGSRAGIYQPRDNHYVTTTDRAHDVSGTTALLDEMVPEEKVLKHLPPATPAVLHVAGFFLFSRQQHRRRVRAVLTTCVSDQGHHEKEIARLLAAKDEARRIKDNEVIMMQSQVTALVAGKR